jgi:hypothetical protein
MTRKSTTPGVGQWWADSDKRMRSGSLFLRVGQIVEIQDRGNHEQALFQWRPKQVPKIYGKNVTKSWVRTSRLRSGSRGYLYLGYKEPPAQVSMEDL